MMDDLAHTLQIPKRSLQQVAISGKWGRIPGKLKPFDSLKVNELKQELTARRLPPLVEFPVSGRM